MNLRIFLALFFTSSLLTAQNFAVLHWNKEYSKSLNYSHLENADRDSVETFQFSHLENEASTDFRNFMAYISNGENEIKRFEKTDTLKVFKSDSLTLTYLKESYYVEQQFSFMEDEEFEEVGDDFVNSKPDSLSDQGPKKILQENYYWVGKNVNLNGKTLDVLVERNTSDERMLVVEKAFLFDFLKNSTYSNYNALSHYSKLNIQTEKSVFAIMKKAYDCVAQGDTTSFNERLLNSIDYKHIKGKFNKELNAIVNYDSASFLEDFDKAYFSFENQGFSEVKPLEDCDFSFQITPQDITVKSYFSTLRVELSDKKVIQIMVKLTTTPRGLVFQNAPTVSFDSTLISSVKETSKLESITDFNQFINKPLFELLNAASGSIKKWTIQDKIINLHLMEGVIRVKIKGSLKSGKIEDFEAFKVKSIQLPDVASIDESTSTKS